MTLSYSLRPLRVVHLVDDTNWGGVTRGLGFLGRDFMDVATAQHEIVAVPANSLRAPEVEADLIVSHLTISWRNMSRLTALRARYPDLPMAHVEHSYCEGFVAGNVFRRLRFNTLLRSAFALFDLVCAVSAAQGAWLVARGLVEAERMQVLRSCAGISEFLSLPVVRDAPRHFGVFGRFCTQKGFDILIPAFRAIARQDITLTFVGDGPMRAALEQLAEDDPRISFVGYSSSPAAMMARFDAVLMPSRWEAYGLVALETMAAGRGLLVSGVDGLADHVARGATRCSGRTAADWTAAIEAMAAQDPVQGYVQRLAMRENVRNAEVMFREGYDALVNRLLQPVGLRASA